MTVEKTERWNVSWFCSGLAIKLTCRTRCIPSPGFPFFLFLFLQNVILKRWAVEYLKLLTIKLFQVSMCVCGKRGESMERPHRERERADVERENRERDREQTHRESTGRERAQREGEREREGPEGESREYIERTDTERAQKERAARERDRERERESRWFAQCTGMGYMFVLTHRIIFYFECMNVSERLLNPSVCTCM